MLKKLYLLRYVDVINIDMCKARSIHLLTFNTILACIQEKSFKQDILCHNIDKIEDEMLRHDNKKNAPSEKMSTHCANTY